MTEVINANDGQVGEGGQVSQDPTRSEKRFTDLTNKLSEQERIHNLAIEEKDKAIKKSSEEAKQARFEADLLRESSTYPQAVNYTDDIKSYVEKGLSVAEATKLVLANNNQLDTRDDQNRDKIGSVSLGGSSVNANRGGQKDPKTMTQEERRAELLRLESTGELQASLKSGLNISGD